ncbi:unnamed protein product [Polarella glacialis]|uniref:G-protein coupled receptors family 1 profile domain-containing protein n=1 Tax=Polarella glacialis TaxID=89957 RepID=A0A813GLJ8_POLGL|nr:unnamed protein product [Polarella glacialis]
MPYDTLPHDTAFVDRWSKMRTRPENSALVTYWGIWFLTAAVSGFANLFIIILIRAKPHLWKKPFNKYVVSLAFPDCVFSICCAVTCGLHFMHGTWYGGAVHCNIQNVYVMFGITASIWMNVVVARQIYLMADCAARQQEYAPPTSRDVMTHILGVYTFAMVIAVLPISPWPGPKANAARGMACLPLEADELSTILMWTLYLPSVLVVPVLLLAWYFFGAYRLLLRHQDMKVAQCRISKASSAFSCTFSKTTSEVNSAACSASREGVTKVASCPYEAGEHSPLFRALLPSELVASLRVQAVEEMRATERTPMTVVSYRDFVAHGSVPRSSDRLQRPLGESDITVFVSHRWWGEAASARDGNRHVDNDQLYKFQILCRGLRKLSKKHGLDLEKLAIWMDFACIEQDIPELLLAGVESLLSYASRSQFILIPVFPQPAAVQAFQDAEHPMDLLDYGERGWCRLEAYVFLCLGEITGRAVSCCGYGLLFQCKDSKVFGEEFKALGTKQGCFGFKSSYEQLKPLMGGSAAFKREQLPSSGKFTVESDRVLILASEARIQNVYCRHNPHCHSGASQSQRPRDSQPVCAGCQTAHLCPDASADHPVPVLQQSAQVVAAEQPAALVWSPAATQALLRVLSA